MKATWTALKRLIPPRWRRRIRDWQRHVESGFTSHKAAIDRLSVFWPSSSNYWRYPELAYDAANGFPAELLQLAIAWASGPDWFEYHESPEAFTLDSADASDLRDLFRQHGSDKATLHDYHVVYADILNRLGRHSPLHVLEIGLGSNEPNLISSMGPRGRPGASVRALRDFLPNAHVYGADLDATTLFTEPRIVTAPVDQLDKGSFATMVDVLGCDRFDLIIDDGLHSVVANMNSLDFALKALRPGGWFVVEDIPDRSLVAWRMVAKVIGADARRCHLVKCAQANLFAVQVRVDDGD